jgi:hypothetical protein
VFDSQVLHWDVEELAIPPLSRGYRCLTNHFLIQKCGQNPNVTENKTSVEGKKKIKPRI